MDNVNRPDIEYRKCITVQQQRRKARVSQEKRASDNDFAMSSTTVPKTEILFAHRILHFLHEKKSTKKKKHVVIKNSVLQFKIHYCHRDHRYFLINAILGLMFDADVCSKILIPGKELERLLGWIHPCSH